MRIVGKVEASTPLKSFMLADRTEAGGGRVE